MEKKLPMRQCAISHERLIKKDLFRIVRTPEGEIKVDESGKANGRGVYLKKDKNIIAKAKKNKVLDKHLETMVPDEIYDILLDLLSKEEV